MPDHQNTSLEVNENGPLYELPFAETVRRFPSTGGMSIPTYDWGGDGPPLIIAHATGMHAHTYAPLAQRLRSSFHCYALDIRGQGDAGIPDDGNFDWEGVANDFVVALDGLGLSGRGDVFGIGHSQGGFSILQGALLRPGTFAALFGYEPVVFTLPEGVTYDASDSIMVQQALKRRQIFASREAAYDNYRSKPPFMLIDDDALRAYVAWAFNDLPDGTVALKCVATSEAALFGNSQTQLLHQLPDVDCHVALALSGHTQQNFIDSVPVQHSLLRDSELLHFPTRTHFGLLEGIDEMADVIASTFEPHRR